MTIRWFARRFGVDATEAANSVPDGYRTFNDFFTRALRQGARDIDPESNALICPCDGTISQIGVIEENRLLQAKGVWYTLEELLGGDQQLAKQFTDGRFATIYLAPHNYHRIHMPVAGTLRRECHTGEDLFSVNRITAENIDRLFVLNERLIALFDTTAGPLALILVGALNVGSITTVWGGETRGGHGSDNQWQPQSIDLAKGELAGWFNMGSTVILLGAGATLEWLPQFEAQTTVRMGQRLATIYPDHKQ